MIATLGPLGDVGVIKDTPSALVPLNGWTDAMNVSFQDGKVVRSYGYIESLTPASVRSMRSFARLPRGPFGSTQG